MSVPLLKVQPFAVMPLRCQHQCHSSVNDCAMCLLEDQIQFLPGMASDGPDPTLFALATLLPMSCFPVDSVDQNARYGTTTFQPCQRDGNAHSRKKSLKQLHAYNTPMYTNSLEPGPYSVEMRKQRKDCVSSAFDTDHPKCHNMLSFPPGVQSESSGRYHPYGGDIWDAVPILSASTVCSDQTANWSSSEPANGLGIGETIDQKPLGRAGEPFFLSNRWCSNVSPTSHVFAGALDDMSDKHAEDIWNDFTSCYLDAPQPPQVFPSIVTRVPTPGFCPTFAVVQSDESVLETPTPVEVPSFPAAAVSMALDPAAKQLTIPLWEDQIIPDRAPEHIDKEVDDFPNDMGSAINWDDIEPCLEDTTFDQIDTVNLHQADSMVERSMFGQGPHQPQECNPPGTTSSEDAWCTQMLRDAESFASFTELLNEHRNGPFAAVENCWNPN
jgi:hypothetical protein